MFYDNFLRLCNENNEAPTVVGKKLSIHPSQISRWANTGAQPRRTNLLKIADYFGVSVDDLLKENQPFDIHVFAEKEKMPTPISESELDNLLLQKLMDLSHDEIIKVSAFIDGLIANRK